MWPHQIGSVPVQCPARQLISSMGRSKYYTSPSKQIKSLKRVICHVKSRILVLEQLLCDSGEYEKSSYAMSSSSLLSSSSLPSPMQKRPEIFSDSPPTYQRESSAPEMYNDGEQNQCMQTNSIKSVKNESYTNPFSSAALFKMMDEIFEKHTLEMEKMIKHEIT